MQKLFLHIQLNADRYVFAAFYIWIVNNSPCVYQGSDNFTDMIRKVAHTIADP